MCALDYDVAGAIKQLILEVTAECEVDPERIQLLRSLGDQAKCLRDAALAYDKGRASNPSLAGSSTSKPSSLRLNLLKAFKKAKPMPFSSASSKSSEFGGDQTDESDDSSESSDSDDSNYVEEAIHVMGKMLLEKSNRAYLKIVEELVMILRQWLMELVELQYPDIDFNAQLKRWTKKEKLTLRDMIRNMSSVIRKQGVLVKMAELNKRRTNFGQTLETKLAVELIELMLQEIYVMSFLPFNELVLPLQADNVYDWTKISEAMKGSQKPAECQEAWYTKFHPSLNGKKWSKAENRQLLSLIEQYNLHWDIIASKMSTKRTGFQCYVQYRRFLYKDRPVVLNLWKSEVKANDKKEA